MASEEKPKATATPTPTQNASSSSTAQATVTRSATARSATPNRSSATATGTAPRSASLRSSRPPSQRQSTRRNLRASGGHRQASSMAIMQQKLAEGGSYAKYYKAITQNPFQVKIRCACGRSRNMAWMFLCTWCATGTKVEKGIIYILAHILLSYKA